ncbi:MAG: hypothetical protein ACYS5V_12605, partial [Planctomycetota bacterium]
MSRRADRTQAGGGPPSPWRPIEIYGEGLQPHLGRTWKCYPAWTLVAVYDGPDRTVTKTDLVDPKSGEKRPLDKHFFVNRHVDRRFHIDYPLTVRDSPRLKGLALATAEEEWDALIEKRDQYLAESGLTPAAPAVEIARVMAETFRATSYFKHKPMSPFEQGQRRLDGPIEGLLYKSYCTGCA